MAGKTKLERAEKLYQEIIGKGYMLFHSGGVVRTSPPLPRELDEKVFDLNDKLIEVINRGLN